MSVKSTAKAIFHAFGRKKTVDTTSAALDTKLRRCLTSIDLTLIGIGSTLGSGVYVLTGDIARTTAGPGIVLSFFIAGFASILAGICYAEFGARVPKAGSAYTYTYVTVGEFSGFVVGWNLLLEYGIGSATVTKGLSTYLDAAVNHTISDYTIRKTGQFSMFGDETHLDFVAFSLSILFTIFISLGVKYTSFLNNICTFSNILVIVMVVAMGAFYCDFNNWHDFAPFGVRGIVKGASSCFFAFIGFDVIATSGEEAEKPSKSVPIAIVGTITICFLAYFGVAAVVTMMVPYNHLDGDAALSKAFDNRNNVAKYVVSAGALLGLTGTMIVSLVPMPRLLYSMAKDGLVFKFLGQVNSKTDVPVIATIVTGILTAVMSLLVKLHDLVEMVSIGTLLAYTFVVVSVLLLRYHPVEIGMGKGSLSRAITPTSLNVSMPDAVDPFQNYPDDDAEKMAKPYTSPSVEKSDSFCKLPTDKSYKTVAICVMLGIVEILGFCVIITFWPEELENKNIFVIILLVVLLLALLLSMIVIWKQPENKQALFFKTPLVPWLPFLSLFFNIYLMISLRKLTWLRFAIWMVVGNRACNKMETDDLNTTMLVSNSSSNGTAHKHLEPISTIFKASYFELIVLGLLIATILIGNSLVCLAFNSVSRRLKTITNSFVVSLAMSDIFVGALSLPLWVAFRMGCFTETSPPYFIYLGFDIVCGSASIMNLTAISVERMYAVRFPAKHRDIAHKRSVIVIGVVLVWGSSIAIASLSTLKIMNIWSGYTYFVVVSAFLLPTIVILTSYILIFMTMKARKEQDWRFKQEMRVAVMIGIVIILFLICWFPFFLLNILLYHACPCNNNHYLYPFIPFAKYMHYANSLMNPIIYAYRYPDYRDAFKKLLFNCACNKSQVEKKMQRTASSRSTVSSILPQFNQDEQAREKERQASVSNKSLSIKDTSKQPCSDQRYLLCPQYKPNLGNDVVCQTTAL